MKKSLIVICSIILALTLLISCSSSPKEEVAAESQGLYELFMDKMIYGALLCSDFEPESLGEKSFAGLDEEALKECGIRLTTLFDKKGDAKITCLSGAATYSKSSSYTVTVNSDIVINVEFGDETEETFTILAGTVISFEDLADIEGASQTVVSEGKTFQLVMIGGVIDSITIDGEELNNSLFNIILTQRLPCCFLYVD